MRKSLSKNRCSVDLSDIFNLFKTKEHLIKTLENFLENTYNKCGGGLQSATYFTNSFISQAFFYTLGTPIFRTILGLVLFIFFSLTAKCQTRIQLFISLFLLCLFFLKVLMITHILDSYRDVILKRNEFSCMFQRKE